MERRKLLTAAGAGLALAARRMTGASVESAAGPETIVTQKELADLLAEHNAWNQHVLEVAQRLVGGAEVEGGPMYARASADWPDYLGKNGKHHGASWFMASGLDCGLKESAEESSLKPATPDDDEEGELRPPTLRDVELYREIAATFEAKAAEMEREVASAAAAG